MAPRRWSHLVVAAVLGVLLAACGSDSAGPGDPAPDVQDIWTFFETLGSGDGTITCRDQGHLNIEQNGAAFTGIGSQTGACTGPGGTSDNSGSDSLRSGRIDERSLEFTFGGCAYRATLFATPPDSMAGTVSCAAGGGPPLAGTWLAARGGDFGPPTVSGAPIPPDGDTLFVPGDPFRIRVSVQDDRRLLWVGYRLGAPASVQDSVRVPEQSFENAFALGAIPGAWVGASPIVLFARDAFGQLTDEPVGSVRVYDLVRRPFTTVPLGTTATDLVYEAARQRLYLLEPQDGRVVPLDLGTMTLGTPMPVPTSLPGTMSVGMDLSPSGDSLLVAVTSPAELHVIELATGSAHSVPIEDPGSDSHVALDVQVAAGRAFVYGARTAAGFTTGRLWELDLASGAQQVRTDAGAGDGVLGLSTEFGTSGDGTRMLLIDLHVSCTQLFQLPGGFGPCAPLVSGPMWLPSGSQDGSRWLVRHTLYDGSLAVLGAPVADDAPAGVIAPDASLAYYPTPLGFDIVELPSGAVRERVRVPLPVSRLTLLAAANRLVAWSGAHLSTEPRATDRITVVDLP